VNLLLYSAAQREANGLVRIQGAQLDHLREVIGKGEGETLRVGAIDGDMGQAEIVAMDARQALLRPLLLTPPPAKLPLTLILALPRPKMLRRILRTIAELGVAQVHLINSYRVEKSYWQTPVLQQATVRDYLLQGLQQSRDTVLPAVHYQRRFKPFVEDVLPDLVQGKQALLAHPGQYPACPRGRQTETLLVIGPEGGFIPYEVEKLQTAGCEVVSLGPRILRVENAVSALVGRLF
jgi:RsmE family RNA methyltransferase